MAVLDACQKLLKRLEPYREKYTSEKWPEMINKAYFDRVSLSATGFFKTPDIGYDITTNQGSIFFQCQ